MTKNQFNQIKLLYPNLKIHHAKSYSPCRDITREAWFADIGQEPTGGWRFYEISQREFDQLKSEDYEEH